MFTWPSFRYEFSHLERMRLVLRSCSGCPVCLSDPPTNAAQLATWGWYREPGCTPCSQHLHSSHLLPTRSLNPFHLKTQSIFQLKTLGIPQTHKHAFEMYMLALHFQSRNRGRSKSLTASLHTGAGDSTAWSILGSRYHTQVYTRTHTHIQHREPSQPQVGPNNEAWMHSFSFVPLHICIYHKCLSVEITLRMEQYSN